MWLLWSALTDSLLCACFVCAAFVEFDCVENASLALQRISGYCGVSCAFSKNPLGVRAK